MSKSVGLDSGLDVLLGALDGLFVAETLLFEVLAMVVDIVALGFSIAVLFVEAKALVAVAKTFFQGQAITLVAELDASPLSAVILVSFTQVVVLSATVDRDGRKLLLPEARTLLVGGVLLFGGMGSLT